MNKIIDNKKRHLLKNLLFLSPAAYLAACDVLMNNLKYLVINFQN